MINNLKLIRQIYGATQRDISDMLGVTRSAISQWESGTLKPSEVNLEQLSLFYGVGPEAFFEIDELGEERISLIKETAKKAKIIETKSGANKTSDFKKAFTELPIEVLIDEYMLSTKMILASSERIDLERLEIIKKINEKMGNRLSSIITLRRKEMTDSDGEDLNSLYSSLVINDEQ
ncbi:MAG: helix-turn-helix transcriptional regulator [Culicoidibacterales bacterium]